MEKGWPPTEQLNKNRKHGEGCLYFQRYHEGKCRGNERKGLGNKSLNCESATLTPRSTKTDRMLMNMWHTSSFWELFSDTEGN